MSHKWFYCATQIHSPCSQPSSPQMGHDWHFEKHRHWVIVDTNFQRHLCKPTCLFAEWRVPRRAVLGPGEPAIVAVASALEELTAHVPKWNGSTRPTLRPGNRAQRAPGSLCVPPAPPAPDPPPAWLPTARSGCAVFPNGTVPRGQHSDPNTELSERPAASMFFQHRLPETHHQPGFRQHAVAVTVFPL